jgi:uncharacterized protein (DUF1810 family)
MTGSHDSSVKRDLHDLHRFVRAQEDVYAQALAEIRSGHKRTHWIWYIFPQVAGLGSSPTARRYAISGLEEAEAYLRHPVLGGRLLECMNAVLLVEGLSATQILGSPDDVKLRSCATLFACASEPGSVFERVLEKYYRGAPDPKTLHLLGIVPFPPSQAETGDR